MTKSMDHVRKKLEEIASCVANYAERQLSSGEKYKLGLYDGTFGLLVFMAYYARFSKNKTYDELFDRYLDSCVEAFGEGVYISSFCSGASGMLYALLHLNEQGFTDIDMGNVHEAYKKFLADRMLYDIEQGRYDFMHNALGPALYFLKAGDKIMDVSLAEAVQRLSRTGIWEGNRVKWGTDMNPDRKMTYNISLSHGSSSIILFLSRMIAVGKGSDDAEKLLTAAVNFILSQQYDPVKMGCYFPHTTLEEASFKSRLAWCYGDLGVATALWQAGKAVDNHSWRIKAEEVFTHAASRYGLEDGMVMDAGICHGTAGIAHIFNRMYLETSIPALQHACHYWMEASLSMAVHKNKQAGYKVYHIDDKVDEIEEFSLLTGIPGIGMCLISYLSGKYEDFVWDELFLLSNS